MNNLNKFQSNVSLFRVFDLGEFSSKFCGVIYCPIIE